MSASAIPEKNANKQNRINMWYFVGFVSPDSAEADNGCGKKLNSHSIASCVRNIGVKKIENVRDVLSGHGAELI